MGAEISSFLAQDDAQSVNGVVCERDFSLVDATDATTGDSTTNASTRAFRRNAGDVARREQLFAFCADWDLARVGQFLRWYARFAKNKKNAKRDVEGDDNSVEQLSSQLVAVYSQVDALESDIRALETLLEQLDVELEQAALSPSSPAQTGEGEPAESPERDPSANALPSDLEARKHEAECALRAKFLLLRELKQHLLASIEDADLSCVVRWPLFITAVTKVHFQTDVSANAQLSAHQHPATMGYAMDRDSRAKGHLAEFNKGDILLPPLENHEIEGFTDDSASNSAASVEGSEGGGGDDDDDAENENQEDEAEGKESNAGGNNANGEAGARKASSDDEDDDDEDDDDEEVGKATTDTSAAATAESPAADQLKAQDAVRQENASSPLTSTTLAQHESTIETPVAAAVVAEIPYKDTLKRPRVIKRAVPDLFDTSVRSPVFFGYSLEKQKDEISEVSSEQNALEQREDTLFQQKISDRKSKLESTLVSERGKLQVVAQREVDLQGKREKFWVKRQAELERAKKELDPNDVFFRTHEAQDKRTHDQEAHENEELRRQKVSIEARMQTAQEQFDQTLAKIEQIRSIEFPLGDSRMLFHEAEMDTIQVDINDAKRALAGAKEEYVALKTAKTLVIPGQEGKQRAQLLFAEDQIKAKEKDLESVCVVFENELFLHKRAQEIFEREKLFLPFFLCLNGGECNSQTKTSFTLLEATVALLLGAGGCRVGEKVRFLFTMFAHKDRRGTSFNQSTRIPVLAREAFAGILRVLFELLAKIGDMHPPRGLTTEYLLGLAEREYLKLEVDDESSEVGGMTCFEFESYCVGMVEKSKYLCELLCHPWKYEQLSRFVMQHMSATHQFKLGLTNINDLKFAVARLFVQPREELSRWKKNVIHERALAMGENDPLKTDYSKYLPKRRAKLLSNVVPLDHGGYRNLLNYRMEVILRATVKLQTIWRARKGRQIARLAAEKQAFYHARGVALEDSRAAVEKEWRDKDARPAHSVEKMKFEAKIRMKQVKLRTKGNAFNREQVFALMMEEAVQLAQCEVENRFREMEEELGYLKHAESLELPHSEMGYLKEEISKALVVHLHQAKQETAQVTNMLETITMNEENAKKKVQLKKQKKSRANQAEDGGEEVPETESAAEEGEKHLVDTEDKAARDLRTAARKDNMVFGRFPVELYQSGLTKDEQATQMRLGFSDPPLDSLHLRLKQVCVGMTEFKLTEFLQELPSKRHICDYTHAFRRFDGSYDVSCMERDLYEHFRMVRGSEQLAEALVNIAESDLEFGESTKLLHTIQMESDQVLNRLVAAQTGKVAEENAAIIAKKLIRMGYQVTTEDAEPATATTTTTKNNNNEAEESSALSLVASPNALLVQKEQHDMDERKKRVKEAHARLMDAMKVWRDAELSLLETEKSQLRVNPAYPVLPSHRTKWAERFQHALRLPEKDAQQIQEKYTEVLSVCQDFIETATAIALILVREVYLPLREKSILPTGSSPIDGRRDDVRSTSRLKYEAHDILFKICMDDHGRFECSHELSAKFGGHEIRNSALYLRALSHCENVIVPLECCVDFQGFRVVCSSKVPIEILNLDESGGSIQKVSKQLVYGSDNRGKTIVFQSKELDNVLADAAVRLNLCRHGVRGYQDLTSKMVHAPADMLGYVTTKKKFAVLNFARAMPPEDPEVTPHLTQSTRGMSILWRQLRPEFVNGFHTSLSPDALSSMTYCTPDWQAQSLGVENATLHLMNEVIPAFVKKLSQKPKFFTSRNFDLTAEMHRHGINIRHLGLLRSQFLFALSGTATLQYSTAEIQTTEDFTREIERGSHIYVDGKMCQVSPNAKHLFDAQAITLTLVHKGNSIQNVTVYGGRGDCKEHASEIRALMLAEMVARAFKNITRHMMRVTAKLLGTGVSSHVFKDIVVQLLNLLSGARQGSEAFWNMQLFEGIRSRFGPRAVSEVDKQNMRRNLLSQMRTIVSRATEMLGVKLTRMCLDRLKHHPDCYSFTMEDFAVAGDHYRTKHNMAMLHFSVASLLFLKATVKQATSYKQLLLADRPSGYWTLCERRGLFAAANLGTYGHELSGKYLPGCTLEAEGPIVNIDLNRSLQVHKEARSYVSFPYIASLYPADAESHVTLETWCKCDGHESTRRVVLTMGRFSLTALKCDMWAFTINVKNIDIIAFGSRVELFKWTHLVGSFDGTTLRLYVDGFLQNEVEVESVVDSEIEKREAIIKKTREDIVDMEDEAKGKCFKDVDREIQQFFASKDGKKQIKTVSQKLLDEHDFRVRLSKNAGANVQAAGGAVGSPASPTTTAPLANGGSAQPLLKKDASKVSRTDFEPLAKKQLLRETFDARWQVLAQEFKEMRHRVNLKIEKELEEQSNQDMRQLRIGCLSSVRRKDGKYFFHGNIAHVAYYNNTVLTRDQVNTHYVLAVRDRAHESDYLFSLASSRFSRALAFAQDDKRTLEKFAENVCASLKYDLDHQHAQEMYKKKVRCGLEPFLTTENVHGIAEIMKNLPREPCFGDLFMHCYRSLMEIQPAYFQAVESPQCRLALRELGRMPFAFFLGSRSANAIVNIVGSDGDGDTIDHEREEQEKLTLFADIICKVLREYPTFYGDQLTNMGWLRDLRNAKAVVYFILALEAGEDVRLINLKDVCDITDEDMEVVVKNNRFCTSLEIAKCSLLSDMSLLRVSLCCTQLEVLDISHLDLITDTALVGIGKSCHRLRKLWMNNCHQISDIGVEAVVRTNPKLEELGLSFCERVSDRCFPTIGKCCPGLVVLEVELCMQLGNLAMKHLAVGLANENKLRKLNVAGCRRIGDEGLLAVAKSCTRLKELNVRQCDKLTDVSIRAVTHSCLELEVLNLEEIYLVSHKIFLFDQEGDGRGVVEKNLVKKVKDVNLTGCSGLSDLAVGRLFHRAKQIRAITLSSCTGITDQALAWVLEDMLDKSKCGECLEHVDVSYCPQLSAQAIHQLVVQCPNLTSLNLSGCVYLTDANLVEIITSCEKLVRLEVGFCRELSDQVVLAIAQQLSLEELSLARCVKITDESMLEIAAQFTVLKKLNVSACKKLTEKTLSALLEGCSMLEELDVTHCPLFPPKLLAKFVRKKVKVVNRKLDEVAVNRAVVELETEDAMKKRGENGDEREREAGDSGEERDASAASVSPATAVVLGSVKNAKKPLASSTKNPPGKAPTGTNNNNLPSIYKRHDSDDI
ncbi:F-box/lrr-repeat protein 13 [Globisporangium polare]